jgi:hypothetical protein
MESGVARAAATGLATPYMTNPSHSPSHSLRVIGRAIRWAIRNPMTIAFVVGTILVGAKSLGYEVRLPVSPPQSIVEEVDLAISGGKVDGVRDTGSTLDIKGVVLKYVPIGTPANVATSYLQHEGFKLRAAPMDRATPTTATMSLPSASPTLSFSRLTGFGFFKWEIEIFIETENGVVTRVAGARAVIRAF